jgi:hypothetical protein
MGKSPIWVCCGKRRRIMSHAASGMNARWFYHPILLWGRLTVHKGQGYKIRTNADELLRPASLFLTTLRNRIFFLDTYGSG